MPIRKIKAQSPDPYLGKTKGDTELARLAHLNNIVDQINAGGAGSSLVINDNTSVTSFRIGPVVEETYNNGVLDITIDPYPGYSIYRAKIAMMRVDWPGYGLSYNWYAVTDSKKLQNPAGGTGLTSPNQWRVPSNTDWNTLVTVAGATPGIVLKSKIINKGGSNYLGWASGAEGTDPYNFNAVPSGVRNELGIYGYSVGDLTAFWTSTSITGSTATTYRFSSSSTGVIAGGDTKGSGCSVRLVRAATVTELLLADGATSDTTSLDPYTGNDGKIYTTVKIGTQIWLAQSLRETKYNDNSNILDASGYGNNAAWIAADVAQQGAYAIGQFSSGSVSNVDPVIRYFFNNQILENTFSFSGLGFPAWVATTDINDLPVYNLVRSLLGQNWKKTHIKITPAYDTDDFPIINERTLLIEKADETSDTIIFRPIKKSSTGAITIEDLNNDKGSTISYVYLELLEYNPTYYQQAVGVGLSNL